MILKAFNVMNHPLRQMDRKKKTRRRVTNYALHFEHQIIPAHGLQLSKTCEKPEDVRRGLYNRCVKVSNLYSWIHFIIALATWRWSTVTVVCRHTLLWNNIKPNSWLQSALNVTVGNICHCSLYFIPVPKFVTKESCKGDQHALNEKHYVHASQNSMPLMHRKHERVVTRGPTLLTFCFQLIYYKTVNNTSPLVIPEIK